MMLVLHFQNISVAVEGFLSFADEKLTNIMIQCFGSFSLEVVEMRL